MLKKFVIPIMILSIVIQLLVPFVMIAYGNKAEDDLLKYGKEFKIKVYVQSVYDGMVYYKFYAYDLYQIGRYAILEENEEGYVDLATIQKSKPETPDYISITADNKAKFVDYPIDSDITAWRVLEDSAYLTIKAYNGEFEIVGLYMDGIPAEEWFKTAIVENDEYGKTLLQQKR